MDCSFAFAGAFVLGMGVGAVITVLFVAGLIFRKFKK